jgi:hypothetical protein
MADLGRVFVAGSAENDPTGWAVLLDGELEGKAGAGGSGEFRIKSFIVLAWSNAAPREVVMAFPPAAIDLPAVAIEENAGGTKWKWKLRKFADLTEELAEKKTRGAIEEARRRLTAVELAWNAGGAGKAGTAGKGSFLGITAWGSALVRGHARINALALIDPAGAEAVALGGVHAEISVQASFSASLTDGNTLGVTTQRSCSVRLEVGAGAQLFLDLDELSLSLPPLARDAAELLALDLADFASLPVPVGAAALKKLAGLFQSLGRYLGAGWGNLDVTFLPWKDAAGAVTPPHLALRWLNGRLLFAIAAPGFAKGDFENATVMGLRAKLAFFEAKVSKGGTDLFTVTAATAARAVAADGKEVGVYQATVVPGALALPSVPAGSRLFGPLRFVWQQVDASLVFSPLQFGTGAMEPDGRTVRVLLDFRRVSVALAADPSVVLAMSGKVEITPSGTRVLELQLLEPSVIQLVAAGANAAVAGARQVLQLLAQAKLPAGEIDKLKRVLEVLGKLAGAMAQAAAFVVDTAAELLAQAAAAIGELVAALFQKVAQLAELSAGLGANLDVELRIGLAPLELRQVFITLSGDGPAQTLTAIQALGFTLEVPTGWRPALLLDFASEPGAYFLAIREPASGEKRLASLSTDLWLKTGADAPLESVRDAHPDSGKRPDPAENGNQKPLLEITADDRRGGEIAFVLAGLRRGRAVFLKRAIQEGFRDPVTLPAGVAKVRVIDGALQLVDPEETDVQFGIDFQADRVLPFFGMGESGEGLDFLKKLKEGLGQVVTVKGTDGPTITKREARFGLVLEVKAAGLTTELRLGLKLDIDTFEVSFEGSDVFPLRSRRIEEQALGLTWIVEQENSDERKANAEIEMFRASFANGESGFSLNSAKVQNEAGKARMELHFDGLSGDGTGIVLRVEEFRVGRGGLDLVAKVSDRAVKLNGVDVPFRFTAGGLTIRGGKLTEAVIGGRGQLPPALIGEADCTVNLTFAQGANGIILQGGKVELDKKGDPIVCHSTRFTLTISDLDIGFVADNGYHFYFLITGSLRFTPKPGEFTDGLLKHLADVEFALERVPLTSDPRVLIRHISFQKALNPKREATLFNIFRFELRGFGFHPASPKFEGNPPAMNISGQIELGLGDVLQPKIDFHGLWIAPPAAGESLPRIKADGLGVELQMAGSVKVRGTLLAVDRDTRTVEGRELIPPGYNASGFLGEGALDIPGWGSMQATLGFLEIENLQKQRRNAFFLYLQANHLAIEIPTPFWTFYLREVGFGFGYRYTLAGIKDAEAATSPNQLIKILDDVSRFQNDLHRFSAWKPDADKNNFTLALKGGVQMAPAEDDYDEDTEKVAQNPLFFDLMVALRSDFTFLMSARAWLGVNYYHYEHDQNGLRSRPGTRGFFYISVPRSEVLLRANSDPKGYIGDDFLLLRTGSILRKAVEAVEFSSLLYIRPGLFQWELGWPDQLGVTLSDTSKLRIKVRGGMIFRAAEDGLLYGFNIGAEVYVLFEGRVGSSIGVAVRAELDAKLTARFIAYLAWRFKDSLVYALVTLDARLSFSVEAWMEIDLGFTSFTLRIGFSFSVQFSAAVELAISPGGLGAHVHARIAVQVFGCTLSVGVGFTLGSGRLEDARARVARFLAMSLTADEPAPAPVLAARTGDQEAVAQAEIAQTAAKEPAVPVVPTGPKPVIKRSPFGRPLAPTDFWLVLHAPGTLPKGLEDKKDWAFAMLVPREAENTAHGGFFAAPRGFYQAPPNNVAHVVEGIAGAPNLHYYDHQTGTFEAVAGAQHGPGVRWKARIPVDGGGRSFELHHMFDECYLADTEWNVAGDERKATEWKEPLKLRMHEQAVPVLAGTEAERSEKRRQMQAQRDAQAAEEKFDENAFQARSTVMTMFFDQFIALARDGKRTDADPATALETATAHVTDLGLVFFGPIGELEKLGDAMVRKRDASEGSAGDIEVLNPRVRWFDRIDPLLADDRQGVEADGVKLDWRLAFTFDDSSTKTGAHLRGNPEQFLHHYEITRTIEGAEFEPVTVRVKPAALIGQRTGDRVELVAPDWQFVDTLDGELAVPAAWRTALLPGPSGSDTLAASIAWLKAFPGEEEVTLTYTVTPVDIAGARGLPKSFAVDVRRPTPTVRPATAELRVRQTLAIAQQPIVAAPAPDDLEVYLAINDPAWDDVHDEAKPENYGGFFFIIQRFYRLIVQPEAIEPAGHYGSDGATARLRSPRTLASAHMAGEQPFLFPFSKTTPATEAEPEVDTIEGDEETRRRIGRWARLTAGQPGAVLKDALSKTDRERLRLSMWQMSKTDPRRAASRFALETLVRIVRTDKNGKPLPDPNPIDDLVSRRTVIPSEHVLVALDDAKKVAATAATRPEAFEWPQPLSFPGLGTNQVRAESGFARFKAPAADATLKRLLAKDALTLELVRDTERRILTTIRFAAVPDWANPDTAVPMPNELKAGLTKADAALIADYDLYELDVDELDAVKPPLKKIDFDKNSRVWSRARRVGRIEQLAQSEARLVPEGNKEFIGWQAHYPSVTYRMKQGAALAPDAGGDQPLLSAWYSARESAALFPERRPRLRFFPQPPEDVINELMRGGQPDALEFTLRARPDSRAAGLKDWKLPRLELFPLVLSTHLTPIPPAPAPATVQRDDNQPLLARDIRHALLRIGFVAFKGLKDEEGVANQPLVEWLRDPRALDGLELQIEGHTTRKRWKAANVEDTPERISTGQATLEIDLRSPIHPLLEELLGELAYEARTIDGSENLYRTLSVMVQPPPPVAAGDAGAFLAKLPAAADPYGWGALQALGLAAAIRLFDAALDEFVAPERTAKHVDAVFTTVLKRWRDALGADVALGQPFVELHLKPARDRDTGPFDAVLQGGTEIEEAKLELEDAGLAVLQVSLRPSPLAAWNYWRQELKWQGLLKEKLKDLGDKAKKETWTVANDGDWVVATVDARDKPIVLKKGAVLHGHNVLRRSVREVRLGQPGGKGAAQWAREMDGPIAALDAKDEDSTVLIPTRPDPSKTTPNGADPALTLLARLPANAAPEAVFNHLRCLVVLEKRVEPRVESVTDEGGNEIPGPLLVLKAPADVQKVSAKTLRFRLSTKKSPITTEGVWQPKVVPAAEAPDPFARFQELTPPEWAAAFGAEFEAPQPTELAAIPSAVRAFLSFERALTGFSRELKLPEPKAIPAVAGSLVQWSQRFLEHGASTAAGAATPSLALAAPVRALPWKLAADADGFLTLTLLHSDRWSHTRAYAVKPLSRYHALLKGLSIKAQDEAEPLVTEDQRKELELPRALGFAITHSLRTEKVEPPVFIGARRVKWNAADPDEQDVLEVIVARHGEEALANSNRALFSRLGVPTALMTFARVYRSPDWLNRLVDFGAAQEHPIKPEPLPTRLPEPAKRPVDDPAKQITGPIVGEIAQLYPQLWKGAEIKRLDPLPPQYKLLTLAAERAGAVVSPVSAVVQDDLPRRALAGRQDELMPPVKGHPREPVLLLEDAGNGTGRLSLRHPLLSHAELTPAAATLWQRTDKTDICWWPDPDVAYVLQRRWTQEAGGNTTEVREEDLELRLGAFANAAGAPIMVQTRARGTRLTVAEQPKPKLDQAPVPLLWTLQTRLGFAPPAPGENPVALERITAEDWTDAAHARAFNLKAKAFAAILFPHRVSVDLPPQVGETADEYFARLKTFTSALTAAVTAELQPTQPWHQGRLQRDLLDRLQALADWIVAKGAPVAGDTPDSLRLEAKLPIVIEGVYRIDDQAPPALGGLAQWTELPAADGLLAVWALGLSETLEALDDAATFPPLALKKGRLRALLARKIMGTARGMTLRVVDARARFPKDPKTAPPGLFEQKVRLPDWLEATVNPAP